MTPQALTQYIRQDIRKVVHADRIELYLPFYFRDTRQEPLRLIWDNRGVLSDGGRTIAELKKRVGDLTPYQNSIQSILNACGTVSLESGTKLVVRHFQDLIRGETVCKDYTGGLSRLLRVISLISAVDTLTVSEDGTVWPC